MTTIRKAEEHRPIYVIAGEIWDDWSNPYCGAVPYLEAMSCLDSINDDYGSDRARVVVMYFLANANTWRGETARRIKSELKRLIPS